MTQNNNETRKITIDLEIDTSTKNIGSNPYIKVMHLAGAFNAWRVFPRMFISVYMVLLYQVVNWYMDLGTTATIEQSGLVSVVVGAGAAWFGLYTSSGSTTKNIGGK